ncbi:alpha-glucosidase [Bacteroides luti]|uniref:Alpha-glucosidase n=1 Tax=Bacteroides luti TaxID=1297750 RepID=A0A1M5CF41_9BACE|nr:glycoside hydrolase family 97 protein [Bacteroides luti]SHF53355.1 alpha-glucosidase [Bacteroides luti]
MNKKLLIIVFCSLCAQIGFAQKTQSVSSPDGKIQTSISIGDKITYTVTSNNQTVIEASPISMTLNSGEVWGKNAKLDKSTKRIINQKITSPFYKRAQINDNCNELTLRFKKDWGIKFRVYNDGVAYRFINYRKIPFTVQNEEVKYNFTKDCPATVPYVRLDGVSNYKDFEKQFHNSFENTYTTDNLSKLDSNRLMFLPLVVEAGSGIKVCITEADLESYPGLYLNKAQDGNSLNGVFAPYPKRTEQGGHNMLQFRVKERENYIAKVNGAREFPWRVAIITSEDKQFAESDMTYKLAAPSRVPDYSWVKPGKVAWDWWNDWNIYNVDFEAGINNDTYKYYIDFASANRLEYVILDEGWAVNLKCDLMQVVPEINIKELVDYAAKKNVGIILWAGYHAFNRDMENVCKYYSGLGVKGFKVDFMDRDDQEIVDFNYRAAATCAKYHLILDLHGMYKPAGLNRTYPNVLNFEGVHGLEQLKWSPATTNMVKYDVTIPFIRMAAGPMDYTQGAMRNAAKGCYTPINSEPMSQGTRCHQLGLYVILESPFNMLCDNPSNYMRETECLDFIAKVPTVWDDTKVLDGKIGEYIVTQRQSRNNFYVGGLTDWTPRDLAINFSFLGKGDYKATVFKDGKNAHRAGRDYKKEELVVNASSTLNIHLAPGGGFAIKLEKIN